MQQLPDHPERAERVAYDIDDVCRCTSLGRNTIYNAINNQTLKARKLGKRTVILADDLHQWLGSLPPYQGGVNPCP